MRPMAENKRSSASNTLIAFWKTPTALFTNGDVEKAQGEVGEVVEYAP